MFVRFILPGVLTAVIAYLLGSISFSIIITQKFSHIDVREVGSGNAGATNVLRAAGKRASALTFLLDFAKCAAAMGIGVLLFSAFANISVVTPTTHLSRQFGLYVGGIFCLLGHVFPVYFGFRGGKGVVTCAAMITMIDWRAALIGITIFIVLLICTRIVSLSSILTLLCHPIVTYLLTYYSDYRQGFLCRFKDVPFSFVISNTVFAALLAVVVLLTHIPNIRRILKGQEKKIKFRRTVRLKDKE